MNAKILNPKQKHSYVLRFLPIDDTIPFVSRKVFYIPTEKQDNSIKVLEILGFNESKNNPLYKEAQRCYQNDNYNRAMRIWPKNKYFAKVILISTTDPDVEALDMYLLQFSKQIFEIVEDQLHYQFDRKHKRLFLFAEGGNDFHLNVTSKCHYSDYSTSYFSNKKTNLFSNRQSDIERALSDMLYKKSCFIDKNYKKIINNHIPVASNAKCKDVLERMVTV